jgi:hypothetical protein
MPAEADPGARVAEPVRDGVTPRATLPTSQRHTPVVDSNSTVPTLALRDTLATPRPNGMVNSTSSSTLSRAGPDAPPPAPPRDEMLGPVEGDEAEFVANDADDTEEFAKWPEEGLKDWLNLVGFVERPGTPKRDDAAMT